MKECEIHRKLLEEMETQEPMSDGEGHSDVGDEVSCHASHLDAISDCQLVTSSKFDYFIVGTS